MRPPTPRVLWQFLFILSLSSWMPGCAVREPIADTGPGMEMPFTTETEEAVDAPRAETASIDRQGNIRILYSDGGKPLMVGASSAKDGMADPLVAMAGPPILTLLPVKDLSHGKPIEIRGVGDWQVLLFSLAEEATRLVPGKGVVLDLLHEHELFLFIGQDDELDAVPLSEKPAVVEPGLTLTLPELLLGAFQRIRNEVPGTENLLFDTGDPVYPFVLLQLLKENVVFLRTRLDAILHQIRRAKPV